MDNLIFTLSEALRKVKKVHQIEGRDFELGSHRLMREVEQDIRWVMTELHKINPELTNSTSELQ